MITSWAQAGASFIVSMYLCYFASWYSPLGAIDIVTILVNLALNIWGAVICTIFWHRKQAWDDDEIEYRRDEDEEVVVGLVVSDRHESADDEPSPKKAKKDHKSSKHHKHHKHKKDSRSRELRLSM
jgi:hypothetical protein